MNKIEVGKKYRVTRSARENGNVIKIYKMTKDSAYYETLVGVNGSQSFFGLNSDFCKGLIPYDEDENTKFKVGERYKVTENCFFVKIPTFSNDEIGNVIEIENIENDTVYYKTVKGSKFSRGFMSGSRFAYGLVPVHNNKIIITADGKTTTAKMYDGKKLVKSAKADCHPDDEFVFIIGASIALERLTGQLESNLEVEEHFYNGKVVCVKNKDLESYFTVGKIYDVVDGLLKADMKDRQLDNIRSIKDLNSFFLDNKLEFLEIVE